MLCGRDAVLTMGCLLAQKQHAKPRELPDGTLLSDFTLHIRHLKTGHALRCYLVLVDLIHVLRTTKVDLSHSIIMRRQPQVSLVTSEKEAHVAEVDLVAVVGGGGVGNSDNWEGIQVNLG